MGSVDLTHEKGNEWNFGYKANIGVDRDSGLVYTVEATPANVHDVNMMSKLLHGEKETVYGDSGYTGAEKREDAVVRNNKGKKFVFKSIVVRVRSRSGAKAVNTRQRNGNT